MSEADFRFWSIEVPKNGTKKVPAPSSPADILHLSSITQGSSKGGRTTVFMEANGVKAPLVNLVTEKIENATMDYILTREMNATFSVKGSNSVHVSGYIQPMISDEDLMDDGGMVVPMTNHAVNGFAASSAVRDDEEEDMNPEQADDDDKPGALASKKRKLSEVSNTTDESGAGEEGKKKKKKRKKKKKNQQSEDAEVENKQPESPKDSPKPAAKKKKKQETPKESPKKAATNGKSAETPTKSPTKSKKKKKKSISAGKGVTYRIMKKGQDASPPAKKGTQVTFRYIGQLSDGKTFDKNLTDGLTTKVGSKEMIPGMDLGLVGLRVGEKRKINIPADQGYGSDGAGEDVPPNADLTFVVERID